MTSKTTLMDNIENIKTSYYEENGGKNMFFKNKQKQELSEKICSQMDVKQLIKESIFIVGETSNVFINYNLIKHYISMNILNDIFEHLIECYMKCIDTHGTIILHIDLNSITISALDRYKEIINVLFNKFKERSDSTNIFFSSYTDKIVYYNTPSFMQHILLVLKPYMMMSKIDMSKIKLIDKSESVEKINKLLQG